MKQRIREALSVVLCLAICLSLTTPASATNESNNQGITFSASLNQNTLYVSDVDQTVTMTVNASDAVAVDGVGLYITWPSDSITLTDISGGTKIAGAATKNLGTGQFGWSSEDYEDVEDVTDLVVATFIVPANTPAGTYTLGAEKIELTNNYGTIWEKGATVSTTLTISEPAAPAADYEIWYTLYQTADTEDTPDGYKELKIGETVIATVHLKNNTDATTLQAYDVYLTHSKHLEPSAAAEGSVFDLITGDADANDDVKEAHIQFAADKANQKELANGATVELGTITFTVENTAIFGEGMDITLVEGSEDDGENTTNIAIGSTVGDKKSYYPDVINTVTEKNAEDEDVEVTYSGVEITDSYTVKYDANGGSGAPADETKGHNVEHTLSTTEPTWAGHNFLGWATTSDATEGDCIAVLPENLNEEPITVYAVWEANTFTITFDTDGGNEIADATYEVGATVTAPTDPQKKGYTFNGWNPTLPATMPAENLTVTAQWQINQYTITFDTDGGSTVEAKTQDYNSEVTAPAEPTKAGHSFKGWKNAEGTTVTFPLNMPVDGMALTAIWEANTYDVTFDSNGGSAVEATKVVYNNKVTKPADPSKDGYSFKGWYKDAALENEFNFDTDLITDHTTIYADWILVGYTITFDADGGELATNSMSYDIEDTDTLPKPEYEGYTFGGWKVTSDEKGAWTSADPYAAGTSVYGKWGSVEMTAVWTANPYTVDVETGITGCEELSATNSDGVSGNSAKVGDIINVAVTPADGYKINSVGYYMTADKDNPDKVVTPIENNSFEMPAGNVTITAEFEGNKYEVTLDANGGKFADATEKKTMSVTYGDVYEITEDDPECAGYEFVGWFTEAENGTLVESGTTEVATASNHTLYAHWDPIDYSVTIDSDNIQNGEVGANPAAGVHVGETVTLTATPDEGYKLDGYTVEDTEGNQIDVNADGTFTMPADHVTVTATFVKEDYKVTVDNAIQNGTVTTDATDGIAQMGDTVTLTITPESGYQLKADTLKVTYKGAAGKDAEATVTDNKFTMPAADVTITAEFELKELDVIVSDQIDETKGAVTTDQEDGTAKMGDEVILTVTPEGGYELDEITVKYVDADGNEQPVDVDENGKFIMPEADVTIVATFKVVTYKITFDLQGGEFSDEIKATLNAEGKLEYDIEDETVLPEPSKPNHTFDGWILEATADGWPDGEYAKGTTVKGKWGHVTLKANWTATVSLKVEDYRYTNEVGYKLLRVADTLETNTVYLFDGQPMYHTTHSAYLVNTGDSGVFYILVEDKYVADGALNDEGNKLLTTDSGTRTLLEYNGDINADGMLNIADANVVYQMIEKGDGYYTIANVETAERLKADMSATIENESDHRGSIADVNAIVNKINGEEVTSSPNG